VFSVVQRRTMSHTDMGVVGATTDTFILFENGVRRNRLVLPRLSTASTIEFTTGTATKADTAASRILFSFNVFVRRGLWTIPARPERLALPILRTEFVPITTALSRNSGSAGRVSG
jgi:hypothetical protein